MGSFTAEMAKRTDAELLEVAASPEGTYRPEALEAAFDELKSRNLAPERTIEEAKAARKVADESRATVPLGVGRILTAILATVFFPLLAFLWLLVASQFERDGYKKRAKTMRWIAIGYLGALIAGVILLARVGQW